MCFNVVHEEIVSRLAEAPTLRPSTRTKGDSLASLKALTPKPVQLTDLS